MSFFDDKQEILKVELTTYGRYLISRGKFKPVYYAFFDDDILYDSEYANLSESQNAIQTRILDETPSLKPQTTFTSLENSIKTNTLRFEDEEKLKQEESQISADKNYALSFPLANSSTTAIYAPSWSLKFLNGSINDFKEYINNASGSYEILQPFLKYPQISLEPNLYHILKSKNDPALKTDYNQIYSFYSGSDQYIYSIKDQPILMELKENNVEDELKNFDIQLFVEEEEKIVGTDTTKKVLRQLNFKKQTIEIDDGILLDEPKSFSVEEDESLVEYFFELTVDDEIELPAQQKVNVNPYTGDKNKPPFGADC